tara:strand:+ start:191 stop:931 length:741 start_codon:yes stop_codon:yes gene_type:complete
MTTIGILIPLCSRKQKWVNVLDIDFFNNFLPYFYSTISNKYNYRFYFAIDENDKFLNDNREDIERCLNEDDKIIIAPKEYNGNPYGIWNLLLEAAKDECEYFYQCGSDIQHITKDWDHYFVRTLKKNNNIGITGGVDKHFWLERIFRNLNGILENVFFHKTHYKIFKRFINPKFKSWYGDDYISQVYRHHNATFISSNHLYFNANRVGGHQPDKNRYEPTTEMEKTWRDIAKEDSKFIKEYIKITK